MGTDKDIARLRQLIDEIVSQAAGIQEQYLETVFKKLKLKELAEYQELLEMDLARKLKEQSDQGE